MYAMHIKIKLQNVIENHTFVFEQRLLELGMIFMDLFCLTEVSSVL